MEKQLPEEDIQLIKLQYKRLMDSQRHYERQQAKRDLDYLTYAGIFVLVSLAFIVMQSRGVVTDYRIGVIFIGIGVLLCSLLSMSFISSGLDRKLVQHINVGKELEEKYSHIITSTYFQDIDSMRKVVPILPWFYVHYPIFLLEFD